MNTFYDWLMKQKGRECPVGDLATDVAGDCNFPKNAAALSVVLQHIRSRTSNQAAIEAAVEGWLEYLGSNNRGFDILIAIKDGIRFGYQCGFDAAVDDEGSDGDAVAEDRYTEIFL